MAIANTIDKQEVEHVMSLCDTYKKKVLYTSLTGFIGCYKRRRWTVSCKMHIILYADFNCRNCMFRHDTEIGGCMLALANVVR